MKKIFAITIIIVMMLGIFTVCEAELPDISGLSDEELIRLRSEINSRLDYCGDYLPKLPIGYEVGVDIPVGAYSISVKELYNDCEKLGIVLYYGEFRDVNGIIDDQANGQYYEVPEGYTFTCDLKEGMLLITEGGVLHLELIT